MPSKQPNDPSSARFDEALIVSEIERLRQDIDGLKSPSKDPWRKFATSLGIIGGLLGILSALVTFPKNLRDTLDSVFPRANITYEQTSMSIKFDPVHPAFKLAVPVYIHNVGSATDTLDTATGRIMYSPAMASGAIQTDNVQEFDAGPGDFTFYDKSDMTLLPMPFGSEEGKTILISIDFDNGTFAKAGQNTLELDLTTGGKTMKAIRYCFYLDDQQIKELQSSKQETGKTFLNPLC